MTRRKFLLGSAGTLAAFAAGGTVLRDMLAAPARAAEGEFEISKTAEEWRSILTKEQFAVLREEATERAFTSPLNDEKRAGLYHCAGCDLPLYSSETKFDSGHRLAKLL